MFMQQFGSVINCTKRLSFDKWEYYDMHIEPDGDSGIAFRIIGRDGKTIRYDTGIPIDSVLSGIRYLRQMNPSSLCLKNVKAYYIISDNHILIYNTESDRNNIGILYLDDAQAKKVDNRSIYTMNGQIFYVESALLFDAVSAIKDVLDGNK